MERSHTVSIEQLKTVPYFNATGWSPDRAISSLSFFVDGKWHCWLPANGELRKLLMRPVEANYLGDRPERPTDRCFKLFDFTAQRASFTDIRRYTQGIWDDFQDLGTSLAKINLFFEASKEKKRYTTRFVQTEIEFIVMVCRSIYDLLQEMIAAHWKRIELFDPKRKKQALPESFAKVTLKEDTPRTADQLIDRYGLTKPFADWYVSQADYFVLLRRLRNDMNHGGGRAANIIYSTERGFAIHRGEKPWCKLFDWPSEVELQHGLVPIRPVLCSIISRVMQATDSLAEMLERSIQWPPEMFPGFKYYSRGYCDRELWEMQEVINNAWWCDTRAPYTEPVEASFSDELEESQPAQAT